MAGTRQGARRRARRQGNRRHRAKRWAGRSAPFDIPADVYAAWDAKAARRGKSRSRVGRACCKPMPQHSRKKRPNCTRRMRGELPGNFDKVVTDYIATCVEKKETIATRKASQNAIQAYAQALPEFLGGSADLTGSNLTNWKECVAVRGDQAGNHINYGVREFGMSAIMNGIALHGGYHPVRRHLPDLLRLQPQCVAHGCADETALDLRLHARFDRPRRRRPDASIGRARIEPAPDSAIWITGVRAIRLNRPWHGSRRSKRQDGPSTLIFSRQNLPFQERTAEQIANIRRGGYVLRDAADAKVDPDRNRFGNRTRDQGRRCTDKARHRGARRLDAVHRRLRSPGCGLQGQRAAKGMPRVAVEAGVTDVLAQVRRASKAAWSASIHSANRRRPACCSSISASPSRTSSPPSGKRWRDRTSRFVRATVDDARRSPHVRIDSWRTTYRGMMPDAYLDGMQCRREHRDVGRRCCGRVPNDCNTIRGGSRRRTWSASLPATVAEPKNSDWMPN